MPAVGDSCYCGAGADSMGYNTSALSVQEIIGPGAATLNYGLFLNAILNFLVVASFWIANRLKAKAADPNDKSVPPPKKIIVLGEIRNLIAHRETGSRGY